jgi:hypothetical protein
MHNPLSNMRLASGVIRLRSLKQAGVQVGLGLDGGTNDTSDMFNNMRAASGLQRASLRADVTPTMTQVLRMATVDGAALLNMSDRIDSLTVGKTSRLDHPGSGRREFRAGVRHRQPDRLERTASERGVGVRRRPCRQTERKAGRYVGARERVGNVLVGPLARCRLRALVRHADAFGVSGHFCPAAVA